MSKKTLNTRIQNKRGTTAEWAAGTAPNFIPWDGEIVAYTDVHRIKIGDGTTKVSALPFVDKVRDVTLGGESMVNANGVVELQQTEMTDGYIPVWDNTEKIFKDGYNRNNVVTTDTEQAISGVKRFVSNSSQYPQTIISSNGMGIQSAPNDTIVYSTSITKVSSGSPATINLPSSAGTLALTSDIPIKTATLSGTTLSITLG